MIRRVLANTVLTCLALFLTFTLADPLLPHGKRPVLEAPIELTVRVCAVQPVGLQRDLYLLWRGGCGNHEG